MGEDIECSWLALRHGVVPKVEGGFVRRQSPRRPPDGGWWIAFQAPKDKSKRAAPAAEKQLPERAYGAVTSPIIRGNLQLSFGVSGLGCRHPLRYRPDMRTYRLDAMQGGWFVGGFSPTALQTTACEVAIKTYGAGEHEPKHHHKIADELTVILTGRVRMNERFFEAGDIVHLAPGESVEFHAIEPTTTVVVKLPSMPGDKYIDS